MIRSECHRAKQYIRVQGELAKFGSVVLESEPTIDHQYCEAPLRRAKERAILTLADKLAESLRFAERSAVWTQPQAPANQPVVQLGLPDRNVGRPLRGQRRPVDRQRERHRF